MDALPLKPLLDLLSLGLVRPRAATRRLLDAAPTLADRFTLVGLAAAMQALMTSLAALLAPGFVGVAGVSLRDHVVLAAAVFVGYVVTATLAYNIGARFGGKGAPPEVATGVALQTLLVAALTPLQIVAFGSASAPMLLLYLGLNVWLLAACIAEAHRFEKTGPVAAATMGVFFVAALFISMIVIGLGGGM